VTVGFPKPKSRATEKRVRRVARLSQWDRVRRAVIFRDKGRCRACRKREGLQVHHVRFRSAGGEDSTSNCALLCAECHADIHAYRLTLTGDANKTLKVRRAPQESKRF
jgi:5-methylcytosine-specific restriction endonuclease McrA